MGRASAWCVGDFNVQGLANTAWAFATASSSDAQVFAALARAAELRLSDFSVQALANTAWAFATASRSEAQLFAKLERVTRLRLAILSMQRVVISMERLPYCPAEVNLRLGTAGALILHFGMWLKGCMYSLFFDCFPSDMFF